MFISKYEKEEMRVSIRALQQEIKEIQNQLISLRAHGFTNFAYTTDPAPRKRQGPKWDQAKKLAASERMKKHWAEKKAKKEAA